MSSLFTWGIDYQNQPLLDAWWTPGWNAQSKGYIQVPQNNFLAGGFPANLTYVTVTGNYFDTSSDPISGYLTFYPSTPLIYTLSGMSTFFPQRYAGINQTLLGINQMGDGKIYLRYGKLSSLLMATDNSGFSPTTFTYHVRENLQGGRQYDIAVPSASAPFADISSLIIPGSIRALNDDNNTSHNRLKLPVVSTQYLNVTIDKKYLASMNNPASNPVAFAFISGPGEPTNPDWVTGQWFTDSEPFIAQILVGPSGHVVPVGSYHVWVKITSGAEVPVISIGYLDVF